jgi:hypothetical protein
MDGPVACIRKGRGAYRVFVGKPERRGQIRTPRHRWELISQNGSTRNRMGGMD